jgi:hypothetical protein
VRDITVGGSRYRIVTARRDADWVAFAENADTGERYGIECRDAAEHPAAARVEAWLSWQGEHRDALLALQDAERAYHRTIAGSAFTSPIEGPSAIEIQREALEQVEAARVRLDEIRAQRPE